MKKSLSLEEKIKNDRKNYLSFLKKIRNKKLYVKEAQLNELHKLLWILKILEIKFENNNYYKDIFNNILSIVFLSLSNDIKGIKLFIRNTIEDIFKISCIFFTNVDGINVDEKIGNLSKNIIKFSTEQIIKEKFSQLISDYREMSNVIHSNDLHLKKLDIMSNLNEFKNFYKSSDYIKVIKTISRDIKNFIEIYFMINYKILSYSSFNEQEVNFFREFLSGEVLKFIDNKNFINNIKKIVIKL